MNNDVLKMLVIEDSENDYKLMLRALSKESILVDARRVDTSEALTKAFTEKDWDIVISDNNIPDRRINVHSSLALSRQANPNTPFIIVSGTIGEENAVKLVKMGVNDYILKDNLSRLTVAIKKEVAEAGARLEKMDADRKLKEGEERYRVLAESIGDMFFALDSKLICTFWNKAAEKRTNLTAAEAIGKHLFEIVPFAKNEKVREGLYESINTMEPSTMEVEYTEINPTRYYQVSVYPSSEMHSIIVKDITKAKTIEKQLKFVNQELETFIYRLSHDIRGPLSSVKGLLNIAKTETLQPVAEDLFTQIGRMTGRLEDVIKSLQEVVLIKQEKVELVETNIQDIVSKITPALQGTACNYKVQVSENFADGIFSTDTNFLPLALGKLLTNAIDYKHASRNPEILLNFSKTDSAIQIEVTDNGMGIPKDIQDKVFNMFFRGSLNSKGPGLGLYLAKNAIEKLDGTIQMKSTLNESTTFSIHLPIKKSKATPVFHTL